MSESKVKLTGYVARNYDETRPVETLQSVAPFAKTEIPGIILHYGFKSVLSNLSELRMKAEIHSKYFFEITVSVDVGNLLTGRLYEDKLHETRFANLSYCSKSLNIEIERILGHDLERNTSNAYVYSVADIIRLHDDPLFAHLDIMVFPSKGKERGKPEPMAFLFYSDNILDVTVNNPNKGEPFEIKLPELDGVTTV